MTRLHKTCTCCGESKDADQFGIKRASHDGRNPRCRECRSSTRKGIPGQYRPRYYRGYYEENREQILESVAAYRRDHREYVRGSNAIRDRRVNSVSQCLAAKARSSWTVEDDKVLMADDHRTIYQKAVYLGRSYGACKARRHILRYAKRSVQA